MNYTNQVVEVTGTILDCNLLDDGKYFVHLIPDDPSVLTDLEQRTDELKNEPDLNPFSNEYTEYDDGCHSDNYTIYKDKVVDGCNVIFETINVPTLKGVLRDYEYNEQFLYKRARVLGGLHKFKGGNVGVMFHLVDEVADIVTDFDIELEDVETPLDDDDWLF